MTSVPVSFGSSPITTSIAAPNRNPVTTARDRNCAIQPILNTASRRNSSPDASVIPATNEATSPSPVMPAAATALAATAASPELGPIEICRQVPKTAYSSARGRRGVEAVLQRDPGDAGVAEVLRHDQRRDRHAGDQVAAQPAAVVGAQPADDRQQPGCSPHPGRVPAPGDPGITPSGLVRAPSPQHETGPQRVVAGRERTWPCRSGRRCPRPRDHRGASVRRRRSRAPARGTWCRRWSRAAAPAARQPAVVGEQREPGGRAGSAGRAIDLAVGEDGHVALVRRRRSSPRSSYRMVP